MALWALAHVVQIRGKPLLVETERLDDTKNSVGIHNVLGKSWRLLLRLREKAISPREGAVLFIKGSVLLEDNDA
jgi:hypothetical protein